MNESDYYFERFGFCPRQILTPPVAELGLVVVIPCFNESELLDALTSLWDCLRPRAAVEVIIVINSPIDAPAEIVERNRETAGEAEVWIDRHDDPSFRFHLLQFPDLPPKRAGVGLARKIGMDEALCRLDRVRRLDAPIVCFDADCTCDPNYLQEIESFFQAHAHSPGCSVYFEHPLEGILDPAIYEAATLYELHLRYYVEALRFAAFPHAFHTIGSSMATRAQAYMKQGGMNKRQAGEDFYFLHKLIPLGVFGEVNTTRVLASPRPSERVPFGTGRAVREFLVARSFSSYPIQAFEDLFKLFKDVDALRESDQLFEDLTPALRSFLEAQQVSTQLARIRQNTSSLAAFRKRFFSWFDGFLAMKYVHYARDIAYGPAEVLDVASVIYERRTGSVAAATPRDLLLQYRAFQRSRGTVATPPVLR